MTPCYLLRDNEIIRGVKEDITMSQKSLTTVLPTYQLIVMEKVNGVEHLIKGILKWVSHDRSTAS